MPDDIALVECVHRDIGAHQVGDDVGLQVGKSQHQVRFERQDLADVGGGEGGDSRLLLAHARRPHRVAGDADDAVVFAEEIERLDGFFGEADDAGGWVHARIIH